MGGAEDFFYSLGGHIEKTGAAIGSDVQRAVNVPLSLGENTVKVATGLGNAAVKVADGVAGLAQNGLLIPLVIIGVVLFLKK